MSKDSFRRYLSQLQAHGLADAGAQVLNVCATPFGARGDFVADDTDALQKALDAAGTAEAGVLPGTTGGVVFLPAQCTFKVSTALVVPSNVILMGAGPSSVLKAADNFDGTLVTFANGTSYAELRSLTLDGNSANQSSGTLVSILGVCSHITIAGDVRFVDPKSASIGVGTGSTDIQIGNQPGEVDARVLGARGDALLLTDAAMTADSDTLTSATGGFTTAMVGRVCEVVQAGVADALGGTRNLVTTVASVESSTSCTLAAAATTAVSGVRAVIGLDDRTRLQEALNAASNAGTKTVRIPAGSYYVGSPLSVGSNTFLVGDGPGVTTLRAAANVTPVSLDTVADCGVSDMTIEGFGPDGTATGLSFQSCIQIKDSQHVWIDRVHCRYAQTGILIRDQATTHVFLDDVLISSITTSNGTVDGGSGIGLWVFNGPTLVTGSNILITQTGRHGLMLDAGTTSATLASEHAEITHCAFGDVVITNAGYGGATGGALVLNGARHCTFSDFSINTTGANCDAVVIEGDQNGEYTRDSVLSNFTARSVGGRPLTIASAQRNTIVGFRCYDFNTAQSASNNAAIYIGGYTDFNAANTVAAPDTVDNTIIGFEVEYLGADASKFTYGVVFQGGQSGPDGSGGTRTMLTKRNRVLHSRFRTPQTGLVVYVGGASCPSTGSDANTAWEHHQRMVSGSLVWSTLVQGDADMRLQILNSGKMQWGDGTNAPDVSLLRFAANTLEIDNKLLVRGASGDTSGVLLQVLRDGDNQSAFQARADRKLYLGNGTTTDVTLYRSDTDTLKTDDSLIVGTNLQVAGMVGFYGTTPASQPSALVQTYSTADRTLGAYTADVESTAYAGATDGEAKLDDLNALRTAYENLRAFVEDLAQHHNALVDDLQSLGLER